MSKLRKLLRYTVCGLFLVQLTGCCCCDPEISEEFSKGFAEGFSEEMERQQKEVVQQQAKQVEAMQKEIEAQVAEQQAAVEPAPAPKPQKKATEGVALFVDTDLKAKELKYPELQISVNRATGKAEGVFAGEYYGKPFKQRIEGTVARKSGAIVLNDAGKQRSGQKVDITISGAHSDGKYSGRIKGKINGKSFYAPYNAREQNP